MKAAVISRLAAHDPEASATLEARSANKLRQLYINPAYGWEISGKLARARRPFPETVSGRDEWLFRAYMMCLDPVTHHDHDVESAYFLSREPTTAATLKAMLMTGLGDPVPAHLSRVAEAAGIPRSTVEAFEILFFNVLDRCKDGLYISNIVYPEGRQVEFEEDYFATTPVSDLILRAGYNHRDIELVGRLAGMGEDEDPAQPGARRDLEAELEKRFMANGLVMAYCNLLNHRNAGMQRVWALLTASGQRRNNAQAQAQAQGAEAPEDHDLAAELALALARAAPLRDPGPEEPQPPSRPG